MNRYLRTHCFNLVLILGLSLLSKWSYSQTAQEFVGDWKIIKVELSPSAGQEEKQMLALLKPIFLKSMFHFRPNNSFSFNSPDDDLSIKDGVWQFDEKKQYLRVTELKSKGIAGQLMGITVKDTNGGYLFFMEETPVILTVVKKT